MDMQGFRDAVDSASVQELHEPPRGHLGPSQLGGKCFRQPWYDFRMFTPPNPVPNAAMERLANRGHEEEHRIVRWLRAVPGVRIRDYRQRLVYYSGVEGTEYRLVDWDDEVPAFFDDVSSSKEHLALAEELGKTPRQWGFSTHGGHHKGSCDGLISGIEKWFPDALGWGLLECKTSNEKSFTKLAGTKGRWDFKLGGLTSRLFVEGKHGLWLAKPEHYKQMQQYLYQLKLSWGLYVAVNKDTDEIYYEFVRAAEEWGARLDDVAGSTIAARKPPPKLSTDPSFYGCGLCPHKEVCHYDAEPAKSCRTCVYSDALLDGDEASWHCGLHRGVIPKEFEPVGCDQWEPIK